MRYSKEGILDVQRSHRDLHFLQQIKRAAALARFQPRVRKETEILIEEARKSGVLEEGIEHAIATQNNLKHFQPSETSK